MVLVGVIRIDTADDERLAGFRNVPDQELLSRHGLFVAEGRLVVKRLLVFSQCETRAVLVTDPAFTSLQETLSTRPALPVYIVPQEVMNGIAGFNVHRGCLALGVRPPARGWRIVSAHARRLVVLERVGDPDNVGTIFRQAAAFGADGVLLQSACADPLYRKTIRTSMGASLIVPYAAAEPWPALLKDLRDAGWATIAMTPNGDATRLREVAADVTGQPVALVLGHEGDGLTREAMEACSHRARIPMAAGIDSLNVAMAAGIALYEMGPGIPTPFHTSTPQRR